MLNIKVLSLLAALLLCAAAWVVRESVAARHEQVRIHQMKRSLTVQPDTAAALSHFKDR
jgi:hypothetical protein